MTHNDLVTVYVSAVRLCLEYACPVWHTKLVLSDNIEIIQQGHQSVFSPEWVTLRYSVIWIH